MKNGFTLIELLVVILIVGILAAFAMPYYRRAVEISRAAEVFSLFDVFEKGVYLDVVKNGPNALFLPRKENQAVFNRMTVGIEHLYQGEQWVCSKHFMYRADCKKGTDYTCTFYAYRMSDDRRVKNRCRSISMEKTLYVLSLTVPLKGESVRCWTQRNEGDPKFAEAIGTLLTEDGKVVGKCAYQV